MLLLLAGGCDHEPATPEIPAAESAAAVGEDPPAAQDPPATTGTAELVTDAVTTETRFGVPIYPRARRIESGRWKMTDALAEGADALTFIALHTSDELDQVVQFYRRRVDAEPEQSFEIENERGRTISLTTTADELASVNIILRSRRGEQGTRIEINRLSLDAARVTPGK